MTKRRRNACRVRPTGQWGSGQSGSAWRDPENCWAIAEHADADDRPDQRGAATTALTVIPSGQEHETASSRSHRRWGKSTRRPDQSRSYSRVGRPSDQRGRISAGTTSWRNLICEVLSRTCR